MILAVLTASPHCTTDVCLRHNGIYDLFDKVFTVADIGMVKGQPEIYENVTDPKQYEILEMSRISGFVDRARGTGRPTKKERRSLDAFIDPAMFGFDDTDDFDFDND